MIAQWALKIKFCLNYTKRASELNGEIKIFVLSEASTGYICALEPYFGKVTTDHMERYPGMG